MALIHVQIAEGLFTAQQKQDIVERLTDVMVEIEGEGMRAAYLVHDRRDPQRSMGHRRPDPDRRRGPGAGARDRRSPLGRRTFAIG